MIPIFDLHNKEITIFKKTNSVYGMILPDKQKQFGVLTTGVQLESMENNNPASYLSISQRFKKNGFTFDFLKKEIIGGDADKIKKEFKLLDLRAFTSDDYSAFFLD